jgi:hypothetical protein
MNQYEPLCLVPIRDSQTRREPSDRERRRLEERSDRELHARIEGLDERCVSVVPRNMRISEFDRPIDEPICELACGVPAESVANRSPGQARQEPALEKPMKIQHQVEATIPQPAYQANQHSGKRQSIRSLEELHELTTREHKCFVDNA